MLCVKDPRTDKKIVDKAQSPASSDELQLRQVRGRNTHVAGRFIQPT